MSDEQGEQSTNAGKSRKPGTFTKNDPRIWKGGRPRSFDMFRELGLAIAAEKIKNGDKVVTIDGHAVTVSEAILRSWAQSKEFAKQRAFIEYTFGKVPDVHEHTGKDGKPIEFIEVEHVGNSDPDTK